MWIFPVTTETKGKYRVIALLPADPAQRPGLCRQIPKTATSFGLMVYFIKLPLCHDHLSYLLIVSALPEAWKSGNASVNRFDQLPRLAMRAPAGQAGAGWQAAPA